jgi:hypothetical protein
MYMSSSITHLLLAMGRTITYLSAILIQQQQSAKSSSEQLATAARRNPPLRRAIEQSAMALEGSMQLGEFT